MKLDHLRAVERDVLELFASRRVVRIPTQEFFRLGPHANADFVRAFEDLEKRWRYIARRTVSGTDILELTAHGAEVLGLPPELGTNAPLERPKPEA
jgi:hypothetical protein